VFSLSYSRCVIAHLLTKWYKGEKRHPKKKKEGEEKRTRPEARRPMHATTPSIDH